ncbi:short-chain dehydrogenase [Phyllobacterium phragmitis]|uniref:Short-chain dehydrogenase n=1 Tax=Phyllobacterium phragmitis TaxID=2670329 RepID=A0A2S9IMZ1_9HYPH|nr:NnrS family protein [Phyllobacterium phragmitis]PRD41852.1 short-chain dehydrogenase [Phyllobacterium phragmitis]
MPVPRIKPGNYPAILSYGFRPFFLLGSLYAGLSILFWLPLFYGHLETASLFAPVDWHIHEMLFGYLAAIVTGFLLTAIPNWTGRLPVQGWPLLLLVILWLIGRFAVFYSGQIGWLAAAVADCAFLLAVAVAAAVEIVAGNNWRNAKVLAPVVVLFVANALFHIEAHLDGLTDASRRLGIGAALVLIMLIGGRIIPSFTRNWLARENPGRLPTPFGRFDAMVIIISSAALAAWTFAPDGLLVGLALLAAGGLNFFRLARWGGDRTLRDPLVFILHMAYIFVPVGFVLAGLAILFPQTVPPIAALHAFGVGAIGSMTLAVMARATLGHTGRDLHAGAGTCMIFAAVTVSAVLRIAVSFTSSTVVLHASAALWAVAFLGYVLLYGRALMTAKLRPRAVRA